MIHAAGLGVVGILATEVIALGQGVDRVGVVERGVQNLGKAGPRGVVKGHPGREHASGSSTAS